MLKTSSPQDAVVLLDDCTPVTATAVGGITWGKTGLTYVSLAGVGVLTVSPSGTYNVVQNYEFSNDLTNWKSAPMQNDSSVPLAENTSVTGAGSAAMTINCKGWLYFRVTITTYTSGTYNCRIVGRAGTATPGTLPVAAIQDGSWNVGTTSYLPNGATALSASSGNVANASAVATLSGAVSKTTHITGFEITASGATAASVVSATVAGVITGTRTYTFTVPAGATVGCTPLIVNFPVPIPASATNTAIVVTLPALGAGNTNATVNAFGYQI